MNTRASDETVALPTSAMADALLSTSLPTFLVFLVVLFAVRLLLDAWHVTRHLPPGPLGFPFIGSLPFMERDAHRTLEKLAKRYGKVFRVYFGSKLFVFIADHKLLREVFKKEVFRSRPSLPFQDILMQGYGVTSADGERWREQRRFTQTALRDVGFAKTAQNRSRVEEHALYNIQLLLEELEKLDGETFDISVLISCTILNNFYALVAGSKPYRIFDPEVHYQIESNEDSFRRTEMMGVVNFFPWLLWLPPLKKNLSIVYNHKLEFQKMTRPLIAKHQQTLEESNPRDLIDAYLIQMNKQEESGDKGHFTEIQLLHLLGDLNGAGHGTTKTTLYWFFLAMMKFPEIQAKVQDELDRVVGRSRKPSLSDLKDLPYTEAVLMETQRYATILPTGVPHAAKEDTTLEGYFIPEGTVICGLFWTFHHDPTLWKNPDNFDPTNFLRDDGTVMKPDYFMPFSIGRRICLGEDIARMNMFLIATHILQDFTLRLAPESESVEMTHSSTFLLSPPPFKMIALQRKI